MKIKNSKYNIFILTFCGLMMGLSSCQPDETQTVVTKFDLVFEDNFDVNGAPDPQKWTYDIGGNGWGNNELQFYTDRTENVVVQDGHLIITAREESFGGSNYTSARLKTENIFDQQYGRFEARIKLPLGKGLWPAFWMLGSNFNEVGWPQCGEIDIMEYIGSNPTEVFGTMHGPGFSGANSIGKKYNLVNDRFDNDFHVFGVEWTENHINWYVDDVLYNQITREDIEAEGGQWVFDNSFFMILNVAVGGNLPGNPDGSAFFPQEMVVDYVRVYK